MHLVCKRCSIEFQGDSSAIPCPRCSAREVVEKQLPKHKSVETSLSLSSHAVSAPTAITTLLPSTSQPSPHSTEPRRFVYGSPLNDTKESWMKFHNASGDVQACPGCGEKEFELDWKRREKTCKKCGEIMPLKRR